MPSLFKALDVMAKSLKGLRGMVGSLEDVIEGGVPLGEVYELAASFRGSVQAFVDTVDGALKHAREAHAGQVENGVALRRDWARSIIPPRGSSPKSSTRPVSG
jgi:DNA helicase II / ATP-dependent DNA helicase PcrA